jgi:hypothetical protein
LLLRAFPLRAVELFPRFLPRDFVERRATFDRGDFAEVRFVLDGGRRDFVFRAEDFGRFRAVDVFLVDRLADFAVGFALRPPPPTAFLTAGGINGSPAATFFPATAPRTPPTTAPTGPTMLPRTAPVAAPAASFEIEGISIFSEGSEVPSGCSCSSAILAPWFRFVITCSQGKPTAARTLGHIIHCRKQQKKALATASAFSQS